MKYSFLFFLGMSLLWTSCTAEKDVWITMQTDKGDLELILYDDAPEHKANFIKLAESGAYDNTIFHRVIEDFMIQGGDVNLKEDTEKIEYTVPAEINERLIHRKGALAAARMGDQVNPKKESSGCQFYIIHGQKYTANEIERMDRNQMISALSRGFQQLLRKEGNDDIKEQLRALQSAGDREGINDLVIASKELIEKEVGDVNIKSMNELQKTVYSQEAGSPHLDGDYSVFGQVINGFETIDAIATVETARMDKPIEDVKIQKIIVEKRKRSDINDQLREKGYPLLGSEDE